MGKQDLLKNMMNQQKKPKKEEILTKKVEQKPNAKLTTSNQIPRTNNNIKSPEKPKFTNHKDQIKREKQKRLTINQDRQTQKRPNFSEEEINEINSQLEYQIDYDLFEGNNDKTQTETKYQKVHSCSHLNSSKKICKECAKVDVDCKEGKCHKICVTRKKRMLRVDRLVGFYFNPRRMLDKQDPSIGSDNEDLNENSQSQSEWGFLWEESSFQPFPFKPRNSKPIVISQEPQQQIIQEQHQQRIRTQKCNCHWSQCQNYYCICHQKQERCTLQCGCFDCHNQRPIIQILRPEPVASNEEMVQEMHENSNIRNLGNSDALEIEDLKFQAFSYP